MNIWPVLVVGTPIVLAVLTWLDFTPNGPRLLAHLKARIQAPRKEREELRKQVEELRRSLDDQVTHIVELRKINDHNLGLYTQLSEWVRDLQADVMGLSRRVADLEVVVKESELDGKPLYRTQEAQRVRQAGKAALKRDGD